MTTHVPTAPALLALPEPNHYRYYETHNIIRSVFQHLKVQITRETHCSITAEIQPDVFICAILRTYGPKRGMIHWMPVYRQVTQGDAGCYVAANRPVEAIAREVRRRAFPDAIAYCKESRERCLRVHDEKLFGDNRRAQLEAILGSMDDRENELISGAYTLVLSKYELEHPDSSIRATITVRNWHCFLMIAKLLAEDERMSK